VEKYEFITDSLGYSNIEREILNYYNLGDANSSDFMELEMGISKEHFIFAKKGTIEFTSIVWKTKDGQFLVTINPKKIRKSH
jgi:hypothetical protein